MRIDFTMSAGGSIDIDPAELEGMTEEERECYINDRVNAAAYEEVDSSLDWEITEE